MILKLPFAVLQLALAVPGSMSAAEDASTSEAVFRAPDADVVVDLRGIAEDACHAYPSSARKPGHCEDLDIPDADVFLSLRARNQLISVSYIRLGDDTAVVTISSKVLAPERRSDARPDGARDMQKGEREGTALAGEPERDYYWPGSNEPFDLFVVNGIPGVRYLTSLHLTDPPIIRAVHAMYIETGFVAVTVESLDLEPAQLVALGEDLLRRVRAPAHRQNTDGFTRIDEQMR